MTLKIGVIGTGMIGRDHTRRIQQVLAGAEVVALSDVNAASAEAVRKDLAPNAKLYDTGEALIAAPEVQAGVKAGVDVVWLEGGNAAWVAAGGKLNAGAHQMAVDRVDRYRRPYEGTNNPVEAMQGYLDWEFGLVEQLARDGTHHFKVI